MSAAPQTERVGQLDVLRAWACMCVLVAHCDSVYEMPPLPTDLGAIGVAIFFALSGYLITGGLLRNANLASFYLKRATRILPPYMLLLLVLWPFWWDIRLAWCATFSFNLLFVSGARDYFHVQQASQAVPPIGHLWSLCVEEHYYWFWPLILCLLGRRAAMAALLVLVLATPAIGVWLIEAMDSRGADPAIVEGVLSRITLTQLTSVAIGSLVALLDNRWLQPRSIGRLRVAPVQLAGIGLIGCGLWLNESVIREAFISLCWNDAQYAQALEPTRIHLWGAGLALIGIPWTGLARLKKWQYVGRISYGLYLYHLPIYAWFGLAAPGKSQTWLTACMALAMTFIVAMLSFHWLERPCIQWGQCHAKQLAQQPPSARRTIGMFGIATSAILLVACVVSLASYRSSPPLAYLLQQTPKIPLEQRRYTLAPTGSAITAYRWLGVDHYIDAMGFRRTTEIPPRDPTVKRILTVGDSYTWGACVRENQTYSAVLEKELQRADRNVEVINCGKAGGQAEDVLMTIRDQLLPLQPDIIIYAATVTDFLPANQGWEDHQPDEWYLPENQQRFMAAVQQMDTVCRQHEIQFVSFVFFQNPSDTHLSAIARHIESLLLRAGGSVVSIEDYLQQHGTRDFRIYVPFDDHPSPQCHRLMAELLADHLRTRLSRTAPLGKLRSHRLPDGGRES